MISDLINEKIDENSEYGEIYKEIKELEEKKNALYREKLETYKKDKRLEHFGLVAQIITLICLFQNIKVLLQHIIIFIAINEAKKITHDNTEMYIETIYSIVCSKLEKQKQLEDIYYSICDEVEKQLEPLKNEVKFYLNNKDYETIINNYHKYENVLPLIENEEYYYVLLFILLELGRKNISLNSLSKNELELLEMLSYCAQQAQKYNNQNQETYGKRLRRINESRRSKKA